jgi:glycosyl transferase family 25
MSPPGATRRLAGAPDAFIKAHRSQSTVHFSSVLTQKDIHTFIISLPKDRPRREYLGNQLEKLGVPFSIVNAVHGASLSAEELDASYDRKKALDLFNRELSKGEIGCALSHITIYRKMVAENIPYALVLEDDANILDEDLSATLAKLAQLHPAHKPAAVLLSHVERYNANKKVPLDDKRTVYEAYRGCCAHAYFITNAAAEILARQLYPAYVVADKWEYFQEYFIAVNALVPYSIGLTSASLSSSIDAQGERIKKLKNRRSFMYYMKRLYSQLVYSIRSRPFIRIEYQDKSGLDLQ